MEELVYERDVDGASLSSMKAGGRVARVCRPRTEEGFIRALTEAGEPFAVLGRGSNVLFSSAGYTGTVLLTEGLSYVEDTEGGFVCGAGYSLTSAAAHAAERGLAGFEFAYGIPGSVGGGVYMNAGAYGGEIKDVLKSVRCVGKDGKVFELSAKDACLAYRESVFMKRDIYILAASFALKEGGQSMNMYSYCERTSARRK